MAADTYRRTLNRRNAPASRLARATCPCERKPASFNEAPQRANLTQAGILPKPFRAAKPQVFASRLFDQLRRLPLPRKMIELIIRLTVPLDWQQRMMAVAAFNPTERINAKRINGTTKCNGPFRPTTRAHRGARHRASRSAGWRPSARRATWETTLAPGSRCRTAKRWNYSTETNDREKITMKAIGNGPCCGERPG